MATQVTSSCCPGEADRISRYSIPNSTGTQREHAEGKSNCDLRVFIRRTLLVVQCWSQAGEAQRGEPYTVVTLNTFSMLRL